MLKKLLVEQSNKIDAKLDKQTEELERHQKMLLEEFDNRLKVIGEVVVSHTAKLDAIMEMTASNTENIEVMKNMLKRKVDMDEYERLEKRVLVLEKKMRMTSA